MMRRFFDALVLPTVLYGVGPSCSPALLADIKKMADVQIALFRQRRKRSVTYNHFQGTVPKAMGALGWSQVIGFMRCLSNMPQNGIRAEILRDNFADAQELPSCGY